MFRKTTMLKVPKMASCPSDINKKVLPINGNNKHFLKFKET
jgi:hypothetical protein